MATPPTGTDEAPAPNPRYFTRQGDGVQAVYNLRDPSPYFELGYEEVDEAAYLASLPDPFQLTPDGE